MTNFYDSATLKNLDKLGSFFKFRRKKLKNAIKNDLLRAEYQYESLQQNNKNLQNKLETYSKKIKSYTQFCIAKQTSLQNKLQET